MTRLQPNKFFTSLPLLLFVFTWRNLPAQSLPQNFPFHALFRLGLQERRDPVWISDHMISKLDYDVFRRSKTGKKKSLDKKVSISFSPDGVYKKESCDERVWSKKLSPSYFLEYDENGIPEKGVAYKTEERKGNASYSFLGQGEIKTDDSGRWISEWGYFSSDTSFVFYDNNGMIVREEKRFAPYYRSAFMHHPVQNVSGNLRYIKIRENMFNEYHDFTGSKTILYELSNQGHPNGILLDSTVCEYDNGLLSTCTSYQTGLSDSLFAPLPLSYEYRFTDTTITRFSYADNRLHKLSFSSREMDITWTYSYDENERVSRMEENYFIPGKKPGTYKWTFGNLTEFHYRMFLP